MWFSKDIVNAGKGVNEKDVSQHFAEEFGRWWILTLRTLEGKGNSLILFQNKIEVGSLKPGLEILSQETWKEGRKTPVIGLLELQGSLSNISQSLKTCEDSRDVYIRPSTRPTIRQCYTKIENPPRFHRLFCSCNQVCPDETQKLITIRNTPTVLRWHRGRMKNI